MCVGACACASARTGGRACTCVGSFINLHRVNRVHILTGNKGLNYFGLFTRAFTDATEP